MPMCVSLGQGRYRATEHTQGPWDPRHQHMGAVTALLVHELDRVPSRFPGLPAARLGVDVFAPVPPAEVELEVRTEMIILRSSPERVRRPAPGQDGYGRAPGRRR